MKRSLLLLILLGAYAVGQTKQVNGKVTYIAVGTIYTSLGRESGVQDSSIVVVLSRKDTIAVLKVFAVSSKSSACTVVRSGRAISVGNDVAAWVRIQEEPKMRADTTTKIAGIGSAGGESWSASATKSLVTRDDGFMQLHGRVSAQYYATEYERSTFSITQPGVVVSLRGMVRDVPLKFELYGNLRTLSYGKASPFSSGARNQARIYRLSLEYDDGANIVSFGRIIPAVAPSIGYIDGALVAHQIGAFALGTAVGYQPSYTLWGVETSFRKFAFFGSYRAGNPQNIMISSAYARTYFHSQLDREVVSVLVNVFSSSGFSLYGNSEVDLRQKSGNAFSLSPAVTSMFLNLSYRVTSMLALGVGGDASRPFYTYSVAQNVPDGFLDRRLRSGLNFNFSLYFPGGITLNETYAPRTSESAFGQEYSNYASINFANILSSGLSIRSNMNLNANEYTKALGYGLNVQKNVASLADVTLRYQQYRYTIRQTNQRDNTQTIGADVMVSLTNSLVLLLTYEKLQGGGAASRSMFAEFSVRF